MGCRNTGSHTRSASSIRVSTCDTAPKIRAAIGRDKVFCVSSASNESAILGESIGTPTIFVHENDVTLVDFAGGRTIASIPSIPNYESSMPVGKESFGGHPDRC